MDFGQRGKSRRVSEERDSALQRPRDSGSRAGDPRVAPTKIKDNARRAGLKPAPTKAAVRQSGVEPACGRQAPAALELGRGFECFCWKAYVQSEILLFRGIAPAALLAGFGT